MRKTLNKLYYQDKLSKFKTDIKKTWTIMTEIIGKTKVKESSFPRNLTIVDTEITEKSLVAKNLNDFFILIYVQTLSPSFQTFSPEINTVLNDFSQMHFSL